MTLGVECCERRTLLDADALNIRSNSTNPRSFMYGGYKIVVLLQTLQMLRLQDVLSPNGPPGSISHARFVLMSRHESAGSDMYCTFENCVVTEVSGVISSGTDAYEVTIAALTRILNEAPIAT